MARLISWIKATSAGTRVNLTIEPGVLTTVLTVLHRVQAESQLICKGGYFYTSSSCLLESSGDTYTCIPARLHPLDMFTSLV